MRDSRIDERLDGDISRAADIIRNAKDFLLVSHIDADGITSAAISSETCNRMGKDFDMVFAKKMDEETIGIINRSKRSAVWITDLGSGYLSEFSRDNVVITDHHVPDQKWRKGQSTLDCFNRIEQVNLHTAKMDGSSEGCGATMTYLVSKRVNEFNRDLAYLAVIGACGDIQDIPGHGLIGLNQIPLQDAVDLGTVVCEKDIRLFGRETRPIVQFLQYSTDPEIKGISGDMKGCTALLESHNIPLKTDDGSARRNTVWNDLDRSQKGYIAEDLISRVNEKDIDLLYGETYSLPEFPREGGLRDAKEFATALNSCGRYDDAETGLRICFGDRTALNEAEENRKRHRQNISSALQYVKEKDLIRVRKYIQYFDAGSEIKETVVGIVAGMILNIKGIRKDIPMIAFADAEDGIKVSARADRSLGDEGLDLSIIMNKASQKVGGFGGGHNVAAGATIPPDKKEKFLDIVEEMVFDQLT